MTGNYNENSYEEISLWHLLMVVKKRYKVMISAFLLVLVPAFLLNFFYLPPVYESMLVLTLPKDVGLGITGDGYYELAQSPAVMHSVKEMIGYEGSTDSLGNHFSFKGDNLITVSAKAKVPELSRQYCEVWFQAFNREVSSLLEKNLEKEKRLFEENLLMSTKKLTAVEEKLSTFQRDNPISFWKSELSVLENELVKEKRNLDELNLEIPVEQARLVQLEKLLAQEEEIIKADGVPVPHPFIFTDNPGVLNPVYLNLNQELIATKTRLAANAEKKGLLVGRINELENQTKALREKIIRLQLEEEELSRDKTETMRLYNDARSKYENSLRIESTLSVVRARILVEPALPEKPVGPRRLMNTAIAGILGLFVGFFLVFALEWYEKEKQGQTRQEGYGLGLN